MFTLNLHFDDKDGKKLKKEKMKSGLTWERFVLVKAGVRTKEEFK
jgi:hypothetical protein